MEKALLDLRGSALAANDMELVKEVDAALGSSTLPASLIGEVAQRGHAALLTQLLKLSTTSAEPSRKIPYDALLTELQRCAHAAIVRGDGAAAAALLPDYDHGIAADGRHLQPEAAALPAYAALLASRRDATALRTLRVAGGADWARAKGDHVTLAYLLASPEQLGAAPPAAAAPAAVAPAAVAPAAAQEENAPENLVSHQQAEEQVKAAADAVKAAADEMKNSMLPSPAPGAAPAKTCTAIMDTASDEWCTTTCATSYCPPTACKCDE